MPSTQPPKPPEWKTKTGNVESAVFPNEKDGRHWRSANFERSNRDDESGTWKHHNIQLSLREINNALRVLMLARKHIDNPPEQSTDVPERAFQIGNVSTAVFRREHEKGTTRDAVLQREYRDGEETKRQRINFFQQELCNAIHVLSQARDYLEEHEADVTSWRQKRTDVTPKA